MKKLSIGDMKKINGGVIDLLGCRGEKELRCCWRVTSDIYGLTAHNCGSLDDYLQL